MLRLFLPLAFLLLAPAAFAQSTAREVVDEMRDAYAEMLDGVDDYTVVSDLYTMYYQRVPGGGPLAFRSSVEMEGLGNLGTSKMGTAAFDQDQLDRIAANATYEGTADVEGRRAHVLYFPDISVLSEEPTDEQGSGRMYVDAEMMMPVKMDMEVENDGRMMRVVIHMKDYREVDGMTYPFLMVMEMPNMADQMSAEDRQQFEQMEREMANMPAEQREMMERMMGDQLAKLKEAMAGGSFTQEIAVTELRVNAGVPADAFDD
jgi:outer membrane lipoprotein-sorting protein